MRAFINTSTNPFYNLSLEEYFLRYSDEDYFILWRNEPTVVVGKNQNVYEEVDLAYLKASGINLIRRITGGGAVYHDLGNINYTFITSREKADVMNFAYFTAPVIKALETLGVNARLEGRNDLTAGGAKFSGNAQFATEKRILHHGTLLFSSDLTVLSRVLRPNEDKFRSKALKSVRSRVCNLMDIIEDSMSTEEFMRYILFFVLKEYSCEDFPESISSEEFEKILEREKSEKFIYGEHISFDFSNYRHFPYGNVKVNLNTRHGTIAKIQISGDFFSESSCDALSLALVGCFFSKESVRSVIEPFITKAVCGMTADDFLSILFD